MANHTTDVVSVPPTGTRLTSACSPFDAKNPFLAPVSVNRELHREGSDRSCMHIEFDTTGSKIRCETRS